ncbi:MAG: rhodanese-like domain-containing protein [Gemmatimonadales bacterium]
MIFQRIYDDLLAQASYLIGCAVTGEAIIVDPNRDLDQYFAAAEREGLRISAVTETHIHADFLSGSRELARRAGAELLLSDCGDKDWKYGFAAVDGARLLHDGDTFNVGNIAFRALHTPGHTPEHLSFIVTDTAASPEPMGILSGDFVFCGDVGRPDLLEKAAKVAGSADSAARTLWKSLDRFRALPDHLQLWPGHGAGSACGKGMSAVPQSTVGYEKRVNWAFQVPDVATFVRNVLAGQVEPPRYFATMKRLNREGPPPLPDRAPLPELPLSQLGADRSAVRVDLRPTAAFAAGHVPGAVNIPWNRSFTGRAGTFLPYDQDLVLILASADGTDLHSVRTALESIGLDRATGWWPADAVGQWILTGGRPELVAQVSATAMPTGAVIVDVRSGVEWGEGHIPGARHIPMEELADRVGELPSDRPIVLHCQSGGRSSIAASVLLARGVPKVANLVGGFTGWAAAGLPVER